MTSLRSHEGELLIDHRNSPGIPEELTHALGLPRGAGRGVFETPTYTCKHCQAVVILNPQRTRERTYCKGCQHLICDGCAAEKHLTGKCRTFDQKVDEFLTSGVL